jgi:hypothetical protein
MVVIYMMVVHGRTAGRLALVWSGLVALSFYLCRVLSCITE